MTQIKHYVYVGRQLFICNKTAVYVERFIEVRAKFCHEKPME